MTAITATIPESILKALGPVTPNTLRKAEAIWEHLHSKGLQPSYLWGWGPNPEHNNKRCLDVMCYRIDGSSGIDRRVGDETVRFLWDNAALFGVKHLIYRQRIISTQTQAGDWRTMEDRGNLTANHYDHVHVNFGSDTFGWTGSGGSTAPSTGTGSSTKKTLSIDGAFGPNTTRRAQQVFGTEQDGEVSNQSYWIRDHNPGLKARDNWKFNGTDKGSDLIRAIQRMLSKKSGKARYSGKIDGLAGPNFWYAFQSWLGLSFSPSNRNITDPSETIKAFQRWLNKQK